MVIVTHELYDSVLVGTGKQKGLEMMTLINTLRCCGTCACRNKVPYFFKVWEPLWHKTRTIALIQFPVDDRSSAQD